MPGPLLLQDTPEVAHVIGKGTTRYLEMAIRARRGRDQSLTGNVRGMRRL